MNAKPLPRPAAQGAPHAQPSSGPAAPAVRLGGHLPALDGVRGLAILMVLLLHFIANSRATTRLEQSVSWVLGYGTYGVDLFFVLSGFLITGILYGARGTSGYFRNFYMRRVLRIFPLYYGVLAIIFVLQLAPGLRGTSLASLAEHRGWLWLYGTNVYIALQGGMTLPYVDHFWSLAVEEHFYFVWPFIVWALASRPIALMRVSLGIALSALGLRVAAHLWHVNPTAIFVLTPFRLDALCLGGFLAVYARQPGGLARLVRVLPTAAALAGALLVGTFLFNRLTPAGFELLRPVRSSLILILLAALLLRALTASPDSAASRFFRSAPMVWLGKYSYGLYVFHHFISYYLMSNGTEVTLSELVGSHLLAVWLQAALGVAASAAIAWASYEAFEKRFISLKDRWSARG